MSLKDFGKHLKIARIKNNLSQRLLAEQLGINHIVLSTWELGKFMPNGYCLLALIIRLKINPVNLREQLNKREILCLK